MRYGKASQQQTGRSWDKTEFGTREEAEDVSAAGSKGDSGQSRGEKRSQIPGMGKACWHCNLGDIFKSLKNSWQAEKMCCPRVRVETTGRVSQQQHGSCEKWWWFYLEQVMQRQITEGGSFKRCLGGWRKCGWMCYEGKERQTFWFQNVAQGRQLYREDSSCGGGQWCRTAWLSKTGKSRTLFGRHSIWNNYREKKTKNKRTSVRYWAWESTGETWAVNAYLSHWCQDGI